MDGIPAGISVREMREKARSIFEDFKAILDKYLLKRMCLEFKTVHKIIWEAFSLLQKPINTVNRQ